MDPSALEKKRAELTALDAELLEIVARRQALSLEIGRVKQDLGRATRDFGRERVVLERARERAAGLGIDPALAERLMLSLIQSSLSVQEQDRIASAGSGDGMRALVIGGSGKMGGWFVTFLTSQGFEVEVADPSPPRPGVVHHPDWRDVPLDHNLVVVAAPLPVTNGVLHGLAARRPRGVVFDVGSLKTPLRSGLEALVAAGVQVTSVHPMFGPDTSLLSGRHVLFVDLGQPSATAVARSLFRATMAELVDMDLDTHDRLIAVVLGLSHALNLSFAEALSRSGEALPLLDRISSTTFDAQLGVTSRVAAENPHLYYEIQALNAYGPASLDALADAVEHLRQLVRDRDEAGFVDMMTAGHAYLTQRAPGRRG